jgi:hypothetical protein
VRCLLGCTALEEIENEGEDSFFLHLIDIRKRKKDENAARFVMRARILELS